MGNAAKKIVKEDILASFKIKQSNLSVTDATRMLSDAANEANIEQFHPSFIDTVIPIARPICATRISKDEIDVTLAIPHDCFEEGSVTGLLNRLNSAIICTEARLVDLYIPDEVLNHFGMSHDTAKILQNQLKTFKNPSYDPWQKSAFIFGVIKGGKGKLDGKITEA